jgi:nitrate reductase NapE component
VNQRENSVNKKGGDEMSRKIMVLTIALAIIAVVAFAVTSVAFADGYGYMEPAPESGDGIPNGSGFDGEVGDGCGPAPNSGDGIPDGSGFECP